MELIGESRPQFGLQAATRLHEGGIPGVEVKFVDIGRNTRGEGGLLVRY